MPTHTAWPTVTQGNIYLTGFGLTLNAAYDSTFQQRIMDAVTSDFEEYTRRRFIPTATGVTRYFDGSGTGEQDVDDYIDLTSVKLMGFLGASGGLSLLNVWETDRDMYPKNRLQIFQGSLPSFTRVYVDRFPEGRSNIECVGQWGYAQYIPANVWEAVAGEYAVRLATLSTYQLDGWVTQWREADVGEIMSLQVPEKYLMEHRTYRNLRDMYKLPVSKHLRLSQRLVK